MILRIIRGSPRARRCPGPQVGCIRVCVCTFRQAQRNGRQAWLRTRILVQGLERAQLSLGSSQAPQGWGQAALAPDLCLTRRSQQLLQGADVTLVCEGPQDIAGHQQDATDRSGDHQGKGRLPALPACVRVVVAAAFVSPALGYLKGGTPILLPSICVSSN